MFTKALQLNRELGKKRDEALTLNNESLSLNALGDHEKALVTRLEALQLAEETEFSGLVVTATGTVGETYLAMQEYDQANQYLQQYSGSGAVFWIQTGRSLGINLIR